MKRGGFAVGGTLPRHLGQAGQRPQLTFGSEGGDVRPGAA